MGLSPGQCVISRSISGDLQDAPREIRCLFLLLLVLLHDSLELRPTELPEVVHLRL